MHAIHTALHKPHAHTRARARVCVCVCIYIYMHGGSYLMWNIEYQIHVAELKNQFVLGTVFLCICSRNNFVTVCNGDISRYSSTVGGFLIFTLNSLLIKPFLL